MEGEVSRPTNEWAKNSVDHMDSADEYQQDCIFASLPRTTRGLPLVISASPDHKQFLYCNGNSVYIRDVESVSKCAIYTDHSTLTTLAKFSPSGFYIASGDQSGKVRLWDATQETHILKGEYPVISGPIRDITWSDDSKRLAVVGEGRERFGHVFLFDTGTSNGNLSGQSRPMSTIDFRPTKPYRLVSGSEDFTVAIFEGPPFKFKNLIHEHTRFVHSVRYNADGSLFASGGADGKVCIFDGGDGTKAGELVDEKCKGMAHSGGVFALAWNPDGQKLATASGDKTIKIWNVVPSRQLEGTVTFGSAIDDQQLAMIWLAKNQIMSVNLAGFINYIDPETSQVVKVIKGHNKPITALAVSIDKKFAFTADFEGNITRWETATGESERVAPQVHKSQVSSLAVSSDGTLVSVGWDDTIAFTSGALGNIESVTPTTERLKSQPRGLAALQSLEKVVVACHKHIVVYSEQRQTLSMDIKYEGTCAAIHKNGKVVAVGGQDSKVRVYDLSPEGNSLVEKKVLQHQGAISSMSFSPDGSHLVVTDISRKVIPYKVEEDYKVASEKEWSFHTARVNCCAWSPNGRYVATGSLDTNIMVWDLERSGEAPLSIKGAHPTSPINRIEWLSENRLLSAGQDSNIKQWTLKL